MPHSTFFKGYFKNRDAGAMVGQGGQRVMQGHFRPKLSLMNQRFGGPGVLPERRLGPQTSDWLKMQSRIIKLI